MGYGYRKTKKCFRGKHLEKIFCWSKPMNGWVTSTISHRFLILFEFVMFPELSVNWIGFFFNLGKFLWYEEVSSFCLLHRLSECTKHSVWWILKSRQTMNFRWDDTSIYGSINLLAVFRVWVFEIVHEEDVNDRNSCLNDNFQSIKKNSELKWELCVMVLGCIVF